MEISKEVKERWDSIGFTDGIKGELKEEIAEIFSPEVFPLHNNTQPHRVINKHKKHRK